MSNPVITPGLRRRRRSFSGPLVLIFVGLLFLLGNLHVLSWARLGLWFAHYWPLLLILWGIIKLIEYQAALRDGTSPPGIGAGGIFLVIVIVFFGLIATQASRFNWGEIRDNMGIDDEDFKNLFGESYSFDDHLERDFPAGASLKVLDNHGAVSVHASDDNKITVIVHKRIGAGNQSDADKFNSQTEPTITTIGGLVTLDAKVEGAGDHPVQTDLAISLPRKASVSIASRHGEVTVVAREGNLEVSTQRGDTSLEEITGNIKLTLERSSAKVEQVTGDVHVEGRLTDVSISDVKGSVQLDGEFMESVKLARITKAVSFKSSRTDMEFARLDGELDLDSGDLHASEIAGPLRLTTRAKDVRLENVSGDVRLQDDNGGVEISMRSLGNVQIDSRKGDIQFSVPEKAGFRVDARTRDGEISSEFPELKIENGDREARASGSVGNATAHLVINNDHGGIELRKTPASGGPKEGTPGGITGGVPGPKQSKPPKALTPPKENVEPTEN
jgi:DUF4097 and DUF4098 domain-containing protein YvlB